MFKIFKFRVVLIFVTMTIFSSTIFINAKQTTDFDEQQEHFEDVETQTEEECKAFEEHIAQATETIDKIVRNTPPRQRKEVLESLAMAIKKTQP